MPRQPTVTRTNIDSALLTLQPRLNEDTTIDAIVGSSYLAVFDDGTDQTRTDSNVVANLTLPASPTAAQFKSALGTVFAFWRNRGKAREGL